MYVRDPCLVDVGAGQQANKQTSKQMRCEIDGAVESEDPVVAEIGGRISWSGQVDENGAQD